MIDLLDGAELVQHIWLDNSMEFDELLETSRHRDILFRQFDLSESQDTLASSVGDKPSPEQIAWVIENIVAFVKAGGGSFLHLVNDFLDGFHHYVALHESGAMELTDFITDALDKGAQIE